jgi:hypothetical protein
MRIIGIFVGWDLIAYSLTAPFWVSAFVLSLPSLILVPVWFALVGRLLTALASEPPAAAQPQAAAQQVKPS